ncbi:MAG: hypothetical protein KatS3mg130_1498 [Candidatus Sumerlaea sp.]|nr:MAG: hypothetical protein KatS3mg130_1498 [Candidatus Sumerlaea sp.]
MRRVRGSLLDLSPFVVKKATAPPLFYCRINAPGAFYSHGYFFLNVVFGRPPNPIQDTPATFCLRISGSASHCAGFC